MSARTWKKVRLVHDENHYLVECEDGRPTGTMVWREKQSGGGWREFYDVSAEDLLEGFFSGELYVEGATANQSLAHLVRVVQSLVEYPAKVLAEDDDAGPDVPYPVRCGSLRFAAGEAVKTVQGLGKHLDDWFPGILGPEPTDVPNDELEEVAS